jgi:uncharacterized protein (TIGR03437 family)
MTVGSISACVLFGSALAATAAVQAPPVIRTIVNAASLNDKIGAGSYITIYGDNLARCTEENRNLSTSMCAAQTTVTGNGARLRLSYASPGQINAVAPDRAGPTDIQVGSGKPYTVTIQSTGIGLFKNFGLAASVRQDNSMLWYGNLAREGEALSFYGTVGGPVTSTEALPPTGYVVSHTAMPAISLDGQALPDSYKPFAGLSSYTALWQWNWIVPPVLPDGTPIRAGAHTATFKTAAILIAVPPKKLRSPHRPTASLRQCVPIAFQVRGLAPV